MNNNIEIVRKVNKLKSILFYPRLYSAFQSTICFFYHGKKRKITPAGSGVFIKYEDNYYVITAAHILAEYYDDTFVILDDKELNIGGRLASSPMPPSGNREDDKIDITILKTDSLSAKELLTRFKAIEITEIEVKHKLSIDKRYFSVGFPLTRTEKIWNKDKIRSLGFTYQAEPILNFNFNKFGFNQSTTIAIKFDGKVTSAKIPQPHLSPDLTGISGSGLWHFYNKNNKSLVGIIIEKVKETGYKGILATKIDIVMKMIQKMG